MSRQPSGSKSSKPSQLPQIVLLSGLLCDESVWTDVAKDLGDLAPVHAFSFAGFSSITDMAKHVLANTEGDMAVAGHSMGGRVAIEMLRLAPDRVKALALLNTGVHAVTAQEPESRGKLVAKARSEGMAAMAQDWLPPMMGANEGRVKALMPGLLAMVERNTPESFSGQIKALLERPDAQSVLPTITVPTLLLSATRDSWSPPEQHATMQDEIVGSRLVVIDDAGHMAPVEQPEAVAAALREWFSPLDTSVLSEVDQMVIRQACADQIVRYAVAMDEGRHEDVAALYTEKAVFARPSDPNALVYGRAAILDSFRARKARAGKHIISNIVIDIETTERVSAHSAIVLYTGEGDTVPHPIAATLVGDFKDVLVRENGVWLFASRRGTVSFKG